MIGSSKINWGKELEDLVGWIIIYNLEGSEIPFHEDRLQNENQLKIVRLSDEQGIIVLDRITHMRGPFRKSLIDELL